MASGGLDLRCLPGQVVGRAWKRLCRVSLPLRSNAGAESPAPRLKVLIGWRRLTLPFRLKLLGRCGVLAQSVLCAVAICLGFAAPAVALPESAGCQLVNQYPSISTSVDSSTGALVRATVYPGPFFPGEVVAYEYSISTSVGVVFAEIGYSQSRYRKYYLSLIHI